MKGKAGLFVGIIVVVVALGGGFLLLGHHQTSQEPRSTDQPATGESSANAITISGFAFAPSANTVKVGTTVTWTNQDSSQHTVTSDTSGGPASDLLSKGDSYSFTFTTAGTFAYHCKLHPDMKGTVVVTP